MSPEDLAIKVLNEAETDLHIFFKGFTPTLELRYNTQQFKKKTKYAPDIGAASNMLFLILRINRFSVEMKLKRSCFSEDEWDIIPKKLNKGLLRLHDKGKLLPLLEVHTLL